MRLIMWAVLILALITLGSFLAGGWRPVVPHRGCSFTLGFQVLHDLVAGVVGDCLENEWFNPDDGNSLQRTTGGLLVWRKADNWTAFTNGSTTWINGPTGLVSRPNDGPLFPWEAAPSPATPVAPATFDSAPV